MVPFQRAVAHIPIGNGAGRKPAVDQARSALASLVVVELLAVEPKLFPTLGIALPNPGVFILSWLTGDKPIEDGNQMVRIRLILLTKTYPCLRTCSIPLYTRAPPGSSPLKFRVVVVLLS